MQDVPTEYEIYVVCERGPKRGTGIGMCAHSAGGKQGHEWFEDYCMTRETAAAIVARIREDNTPGRCQKRPVVYRVTGETRERIDI